MRSVLTTIAISPMPPVDNAYKLRNQEFLQEYAQRPGVKIMFNGVMYREITKGKGPKPSPKSFVTVYYTGKLINGKVFDQTQKGRPATFRLNELITGWITAMREMPVGSRWEVVIPYNLGYGSRPAGAIKAFSTLIFDITLLDVRYRRALRRDICYCVLRKSSIVLTISSAESLIDRSRLLYFPLSIRYCISL